MLDVKLYVLHGRQAGVMIPVTGSRFSIGRAEDCQLRPHSDLISRHHCGITIEGESVLIRDFGSKNGTFVNGRRIEEEVELQAGDRMQVGSLEFEIRITKPVVEPTADPVDIAPEPVAEAPGSDSAIFSGDAPSEGSSASFVAIPGAIPPLTGYPGYAPPAGYAPPGYAPPANYPGYAPQGYPQGYAPPPQGYPAQGYAPPPQGYPAQGYAPPPQGYPAQGYAPPPQGYSQGAVPAPQQAMPVPPRGGLPPLGQASQGWLDDEGAGDGSVGDSSGFYSEGETTPGAGSTVILTAEELARRQAEKAEKASQAQARREAEQNRKKADNAALDSHRQSQVSGQTMADEALRNMLRPF